MQINQLFYVRNGGRNMNQKVEFFQDEYSYKLKRKIDDFAKTHHIESISYSVCKFGCTGYHYCCVVYTDK